jgi:hypothetical protein
MNEASNNLINVFPISKQVFGIGVNWYEFIPRFTDLAFLLLPMFLILSIGIMVLKKFEAVNMDSKLVNIPVIILLLTFWPFIVTGLKDLIDVFNTFLIEDVFRIPWKGFGFPKLKSVNILSWSVEAIVRLLPHLTYWLIYGIYTVYCFFYIVLGPFVLVKGVLFDEIEAFFDLIKELMVLFLWQTTLIVLVALIMPEIVSGKPFTTHTNASVYFLATILGIMILFVPSMTKKFGNHLGHPMYPPGFKWGAVMLGLTASSRGLASTGLNISPHRWTARGSQLMTFTEFEKRSKFQKETSELQDALNDFDNSFKLYNIEDPKKLRSDTMIELFKKAKKEAEDVQNL